VTSEPLESHLPIQEQLGPRTLREPVEQLRNRFIELGREFAEQPDRRQEILATAANEMQRRLAELAELEEQFTRDRIRFEEHLGDAFAREHDARVRAEAASAMNDEFIATVSHELRTPLTAILGWARVLQSLHPDDASTQKAVSSIERSAKAQARLIEDLLDISHIALGRLRLDIRPVDLGTIVAGAINVVTPTAAAKGVSLVAPASAEVLIVLGDGVRLQQVFWNLLSNAIKFTPAAGRVEVDVKGSGSDVRVDVRDTGVGMDREFLPHAFDRFRRGDTGPSRRYGGVGLGLAIVRQLVEAHGGAATAESGGLGLGSTFTVWLPLKDRHGERRREQRLPFDDVDLLDTSDSPPRN
jgi:signal transduction histidine kinase